MAPLPAGRLCILAPHPRAYPPLEALRHNLRAIAAAAGAGRPVLAVEKNNAYEIQIPSMMAFSVALGRMAAPARSRSGM